MDITDKFSVKFNLKLCLGDDWMKVKIQKANMVLLAILLINSLILLLKGMEFYFLILLYLFFGCAIIDICLETKNERDSYLRSWCWIVLYDIYGVALEVYIMRKPVANHTGVVEGVLCLLLILDTVFFTTGCVRHLKKVSQP